MLKATSLAAIAVFIASTFASAQQTSVFDDARECLYAGDYECAYTGMIDYLSDNPLPLVGYNGQLLVRGAVFEAAFRQHADENLNATQTIAQADRYLTVVLQIHPNTRRLLSTGHLLRAIACEKVGDVECLQTSVDAICRTTDALYLPMASANEGDMMNDRIFELMQRHC